MNKKVIEIKDLTYRYPNQTKDCLKKINLTINQGEWVSLIGANGSGKSTLAKLIVGLLEDKGNHIQIFGKIMNAESGNQIRSKVGMVFQNPENQFVSSTVLDDVAFGLENQGIPRNEMKKRVLLALREVEMDSFLNAEPSQLSGGQKQRVALAGVLAQHPDLIILDEATSMLDPATRNQILKIVHKLHKELGTTILAITHDINETKDSDQIILLNHGKIAMRGVAQEIYSQTKLLNECNLSAPLTYQVQQTLRKCGFHLPEKYLNERELIKELWELN